MAPHVRTAYAAVTQAPAVKHTPIVIPGALPVAY